MMMMMMMIVVVTSFDFVSSNLYYIYISECFLFLVIMAINTGSTINAIEVWTDHHVPSDCI